MNIFRANPVPMKKKSLLLLHLFFVATITHAQQITSPEKAYLASYQSEFGPSNVIGQNSITPSKMEILKDSIVVWGTRITGEPVKCIYKNIDGKGIVLVRIYKSKHEDDDWYVFEDNTKINSKDIKINNFSGSY